MTIHQIENLERMLAMRATAALVETATERNLLLLPELRNLFYASICATVGSTLASAALLVGQGQFNADQTAESLTTMAQQSRERLQVAGRKVPKRHHG